MTDFGAVFARFYNAKIKAYRDAEESGDYEDIGSHTLELIGEFAADVQPYTGLSSQNTGAGLFHDFGMLDTSVKRVFAPSEAAGAVVIGNIIEYGGEMYEVMAADARDMGVTAYIRKREVQGYGEELTN